MKKKYLWMLVVICGASVFTSCSDTIDNPVTENDPLAEERAQLQALYGENRKITDGKAKEWPLYDLENKQLMIFDEFDIHPEKESQRKILDWDRTYFLTKYYCI